MLRPSYILLAMLLISVAGGAGVYWHRITVIRAAEEGSRQAQELMAQERAEAEERARVEAEARRKVTTDWNSYLPAIHEYFESTSTLAELGPRFARLDIGSSTPISIYTNVELTGDDISEAIVDVGPIGTSSSHALTVMRLEQDEPVVALFTQAGDETQPMVFIHGINRYSGTAVGAIAEKRLVFYGGWLREENNPDTFESCALKAYVWNEGEKSFVLNGDMSTELVPTFCEKATGWEGATAYVLE